MSETLLRPKKSFKDSDSMSINLSTGGGSRTTRRVSILSDKSTSSCGTNPPGNGSNPSGVTTPLVTIIPDNSFRFAAFEPPELLFNSSTRACDDRGKEFHEHKLVLEDKNASVMHIIGRRFPLLKLGPLCEAKVPGIANCPLKCYLDPENYQLVHKIPTYFISCLDPAEPNVYKESHAVTNFRFNDHSENFDIPTTKLGASYYIMMKEDVLVNSVNDFCQMTSFSSEKELKTMVKFLLLSLRCNLINKFFVTAFLHKQSYMHLLKFLTEKNLARLPELLMECVQVLRVVLSRSVKYGWERHIRQTNKLRPRNSRHSDDNSVDGGAAATATTPASIYTEEDAEAFEAFKADKRFWLSLVQLLLDTQPDTDEGVFGEFWRKGDAYPIVDLLTMAVTLTSNNSDRTPHLTEEIVYQIFDVINDAFERLLENGELPLRDSLPRDSGFAEESQIEKDETVKGLVSDKKLTMCLLLIKLAIKTAETYMMKFTSSISSSQPSGDPVLTKFHEFISHNRVTQLLFRSEFKNKLDMLYPYTEYSYLRKSRRSSGGASVGSGGGTGSSSAPDGEISQMKKMHTRCHRVITKIYQLSFIHFYSQDVLQTVDSSAIRRWREELVSLFKSSSEFDSSASDARISQILDTEFFKHESEEGRMVHFLAVKYFLKNAGYHVLAKLSNKNSTIVPLVKAAFYTTNFVLKLLHMDKHILSSLADSGSSSSSPRASFQSCASSNSPSPSSCSSGDCLLYSYFFSSQSVPREKDLYELLMRLLINFVNTFLYGRPTNAHTHFYKVIRFERMAIERTCLLIAVRWASPTNNKQTPNSREFQEKIVYEKAIEMPTASKSDFPKMEKIREQCRAEATRIWEEQCVNFFSSTSAGSSLSGISCKYRDNNSKDPQNPIVEGSISFQLSSDKSKLEYKIIPTSNKRGNTSVVESSVLIKSCRFHLNLPKETAATLRIDMDQIASSQMTADDNSSLPFPITLEDNKLTDRDINLLYFAECIKIILSSSNLADRFDTQVTRSELEKCSQKLAQRRSLESSIEDLLYKTRTFPLICLPLDKRSSSGPPPELPPLPKCLPMEQCTEL